MDDQVYQLATRARPSRRARIALAGRMLAVAVVVLGGSGAVYPHLPRMFTATADVLLRPTNQEGATTWDQSVRDQLDDNAIQTKIDMLHSDALQFAVASKHNLIADPEFNTSLRPSWFRSTFPWLKPWLPQQQRPEMQVEASLIKHLVVKRDKSYLMKIGYESADPNKATQLANTLASEFRTDQVRRKVRSQEDLLAALRGRISKIEETYQVNERKEQAFVKTSGLIHGGQKVSMDRQLASLSVAYAEARRRTIEITNRAEMLAAHRDGGMDNTTDAITSPLLQRLRERLVEVSTGVGSGSVPAGISQTVLGFFRQAIAAETLRLGKAAQNDAAMARQNEVAIAANIAQLDRQLVEWQLNDLTRIDLHRAVATALDALHDANQRYEQQAGRGDVLESDVEIVSSAEVPDRPSFPNPLLYAVGTLTLIGLLWGIMLLPRIKGLVRGR